MAVDGLNSSYDTYASAYARSTENTAGESSGTGNVIDAVFEKESDRQVSIDDFLVLMVEQLKNQDFMNPVDDTQYVTQLAQFTTMQQMQELAYNAKSTYATSLVGKDVTAAKITVNGDLATTEGPVEKVSLLDGEYVIYVGGKGFTLDEIMEVKPSSQSDGALKKISSQLEDMNKMLDGKLTEGFESIRNAADSGAAGSADGNKVTGGTQGSGSADGNEGTDGSGNADGGGGMDGSGNAGGTGGAEGGGSAGETGGAESSGSTDGTGGAENNGNANETDGADGTGDGSNADSPEGV